MTFKPWWHEPYHDREHQASYEKGVRRSPSVTSSKGWEREQPSSKRVTCRTTPRLSTPTWTASEDWRARMISTAQFAKDQGQTQPPARMRNTIPWDMIKMAPPEVTPAVFRLVSKQTSTSSRNTSDRIQDQTTIRPNLMGIRHPYSSLISIKTILKAPLGNKTQKSSVKSRKRSWIPSNFLFDTSPPRIMGYEVHLLCFSFTMTIAINSDFHSVFPIRVQFWCSLASNLSSQMIFHLLGKLYSRHVTGSVNCENSSVSFVMKYWPTSTVVRNPASIQNFITRSCGDNFSIRSWYLCRSSSCAGSSVKGMCVFITLGTNSGLDCPATTSRPILSWQVLHSSHISETAPKILSWLTEIIVRKIVSTVSPSAQKCIDNFPPTFALEHSSG